MADLPSATAVGAAVGGGGLSSGVGAAVKGLTNGTDPDRDRPAGTGVRVVGVEPETAAPAALSYRDGEPRRYPDWEASFVDGAGGKSLFPRMWTRMRQVVDEVAVVSLDDVEAAMRVLADRTRIIAEGAGALPVAAALDGALGEEGPVVAVVSGGNIDLADFHEHIEPAASSR